MVAAFVLLFVLPQAAQAAPPVCAPAVCAGDGASRSIDLTRASKTGSTSIKKTVKAKTSRSVAGRRTSLRVSVRFAPKGSTPRVTVTGPRSFKRVISKSTSFRNVRPGRYVISAPPLSGTKLATFATYQTTKAKLHKGVVGWVGVRYTQRVAGTTRVVQPSAIAQVTEADANGARRVVVNDPQGLVVPGSVLTSDVGPQTPYGLLVQVNSIARDGQNTIAETTPAPLTAIGPQAELAATPKLSMSASDFSKVVAADPATTPGAFRQSKPGSRLLSGTGGNGFEEPFACTGTKAAVKGELSFEANTEVGVRWGGWLDPLTIEAYAGIHLDQQTKLAVAIAGAGKCDVSLKLLPEDYRFKPWRFMVGPVPVVINPKLNFFLRGNAVTAGPASSRIDQTLDTSFGLAYDGGDYPYPYGDASATYLTYKPNPTGNLNTKTSVGPKISFDFYDAAGPYLTADTYMALKADTTKNPWWKLTAGLQAGGGFKFNVWKIHFDMAVPNIWALESPVAQADGPAPLAIDPAALPAGDMEARYAGQIKLARGKAKSFAVVAGKLPAGLALDAATGKISGTPTGYGTSTFSVRVDDAAGNVARSDFSITVRTKPIALTTTSIPSAVSGTDYRASFAATGSSDPYTWALTGALPAGLTFNAAGGQIIGIPTQTGTFPVTVTVTGADGKTAGRAFTLAVAAPELNITTATLPDGMEGVLYEGKLEATGGEGAYTWSVASGALPAGLSLDARTGAVTGRPTANGTSTFTVKVADTTGHETTREVKWVVYPPGVAIATPTFPTVLQDDAFSGQLSAIGGTAPYTWAVTEGALPAGLTLDATTGAITGAPTAGGTTDFKVTVTDSTGAQGVKSLQIVVTGEPSGTPNALHAIDCWSTAGCIATAYNRTWLYDGTNWTLAASAASGYDFYAISCYSATRCGGVSGSNFWLWDGTAWTNIGRPSPPSGGSAAYAGAISCYTSTRCEGTATEEKGANDTDFSIRIDNASFGRTIPMPEDRQWQIDCLGDTFCASVQPATGFTVFNGSSWTPMMLPVQYEYMTKVSCSSTTSCLIGTGYDDAIVKWSGGTTLTTTTGNGGNTGISTGVDCVVGGTFCGAAWSYPTGLNTVDGGTWGTVQSFTGFTLFGVSCPSATKCIAVGDHARWYEWDGTSWKRQRGFAYN